MYSHLIYLKLVEVHEYYEQGKEGGSEGGKQMYKNAEICFHSIMLGTHVIEIQYQTPKKASRGCGWENNCPKWPSLGVAELNSDSHQPPSAWKGVGMGENLSIMTLISVEAVFSV